MIVVFGSLNTDLVTKVERLPQPGETVLSPDYVMKPGGKGGNQAVAAARAGSVVAMFGCVGNDDFGTRLIQGLNSEGVETEGVLRDERPTGCAFICVDSHGDNSIAVASGANTSAQAAQVPDSVLGAKTTVVLQMEVGPSENWALLERARKAGARTVLNVAPCRGVPGSALAHVDVLIANRIEALAVGREVGIEAETPQQVAWQLHKRFGLACIVTLAAEGSVAAFDGALWQVAALPIEPVDSTGAGDAYVGTLAAALDQGRPLPEALRRASVGAALACMALGAQESLPTSKAIDAELPRLPAPVQLTPA